MAFAAGVGRASASGMAAAWVLASPRARRVRREVMNFMLLGVVSLVSLVNLVG